MIPRRDEVTRPATSAVRARALRPCLAALLLACSFVTARAQGSFNSGSTGADGAFAPTSNVVVQVPPGGVFNYTTINIPPGVVVSYARNARNIPVTILASGNVTIGGQIHIRGQNGKPHGGGFGGPGGFNGGVGGFNLGIAGEVTPGINGDGPGGGGGGSSTNGGGPGGGGGFAVAGKAAIGTAGATGAAGPAYGLTTLTPLVGGSGGGGGSGSANMGNGGGGGGGGGALLIASSGSITFSSSAFIEASGGDGYPAGFSGGGGAGGAIRLIANTITGNLSVNVSGGSGISSGQNRSGDGGHGFVRVEAFDSSDFSPFVSGPAKLTVSTPLPVSAPTAPTLRITSVGGVAAPAAPGGSLLGPPDVVVPTNQPNPVTVALQATNLPTGAVVSVTLTPESGARTTVQSTPLSGTNASSTATASLNLPNGMSVIRASALIDLSSASAAPLFMEGERVTHIEVGATFGGASEVVYVTQSGRRIRKTD